MIISRTARIAVHALAALGVLYSAAPARADEPLFGYTFATDLLPQAGLEFQQWQTWRSGKATGKYDAVEMITQVQYGLTDNFQIGGHLNYEWARALNNNVINGTTLPPGPFAGVAVGPHDELNLTKFTGVSGEFIYRIFSPYLDDFGLAVYAKPTIGPGLRELSSRLILQQNYLDDRLVVAFNVILTQQSRFFRADPTALAGSSRSRDQWYDTSSVAFAIGASYRFVENWSAALEFLNEREWIGFSPFSSSHRTNSGYYFGPSLHFAGQRMFGTLTVLTQLPWASDFANAAPGFIADGRNYAANFERFRVRLKIGYYFGGSS